MRTKDTRHEEYVARLEQEIKKMKNEKKYSINLTKREIENLMNALAEWRKIVGCKDVGAEVGLNDQRYMELIVKIGLPLTYHPGYKENENETE